MGRCAGEFCLVATQGSKLTARVDTRMPRTLAILEWFGPVFQCCRPQRSPIMPHSTHLLLRRSTPTRIAYWLEPKMAFFIPERDLRLIPSAHTRVPCRLREHPLTHRLQVGLGRHVAWTVRVTGTIAGRSLHHNPTGTPVQHVPRVWYEGRMHRDGARVIPPAPWPTKAALNQAFSP